MRAALVLLLAAACGSSSKDTPVDARTTNPPTCPPAPQPQCRDSCGNGALETCYVPDTSHDACFFYYKQMEICDGAKTTTSCVEQGYLGGTAGCQKTPVGFCAFDAKDCAVCASGGSIVECERYTASAGLTGFAAAPTTGDPLLLVATGNSWTIFGANAQGLTQLAQGGVAELLGGVVGVPNGWLAAAMTSPGFALRHIDAAGTATAAQPVGNGPTFSLAMAYGPANRALIAWSEWDGNAQTSRVWIALADAAGAIAVAPTELLAAGTSPEGVSVVTDGTSFFVATTRAGELHRVGSDGVLISSTSGFPIGSGVRVEWSGTTGWYLTKLGSTLHAQRFDATGAPAGTLLQVSLETVDVVAHGDGLVALHNAAATVTTLRKLELQTIDAAGSVSAPIEIGVGSYNPYEPRLTTVGTYVAVTWPHSGRRQVALLAP